MYIMSQRQTSDFALSQDSLPPAFEGAKTGSTGLHPAKDESKCRPLRNTVSFRQFFADAPIREILMLDRGK